MRRSTITTILIGAMGGEGGGVLTGWITAAAGHAGLKAQATSIPGVAQRTGATSYYVEISTSPDVQPQHMSLAPMAGDVDVLISTELVEAGRAVLAGFSRSDRTLLIASTHRVYSIAERAAMGDGRVNSDRILSAAKALSHRAILFDMAAVAQESGAQLNAVLLGALCGSGALNIDEAQFREAIRAGRDTSANLSGFDAGLARSRQLSQTDRSEDPHSRSWSGAASADASTVDVVVAHRTPEEGFPEPARAVVRLALKRLSEYQGNTYAQLYLKRLKWVRDAEQETDGPGALTTSVARHLALRMTFEDLIRVAQVKCSPERINGILQDAKSGGRPAEIIDYLKPGFEEAASILPPRLGAWLVRWSDQKGWLNRKYWAQYVNVTSLSGFALFRLLAGLRGWRPRTYRYAQEQAWIEDWLQDIVRAVGVHPLLAVEISECANLVKGYSDTHRRGLANYAAIKERLFEPALQGAIDGGSAAQAIRGARQAALSDPDGDALKRALGQALPAAL